MPTHESFTKPVKIERFQCVDCGWYADIPDDKSMAFFSREVCPDCGKALTRV